MSGARARKGLRERHPATSDVLVVDDDPAVVRLLKLTLSLGGFDVTSAMNGAEALEEVGRHKPQLILLDVEMPVMDGRAFYHELRRRRYDVPVVVITANDAIRVQRELGAQGHVDKPFEPEDLLETLRALM